jgi:hypothetical protein
MKESYEPTLGLTIEVSDTPYPPAESSTPPAESSPGFEHPIADFCTKIQGLGIRHTLPDYQVVGTVLGSFLFYRYSG